MLKKDLARVVDVHGFVAPLLNNLIKRQYQLDLDVHNTFINLYIPNYLPVIGLRESGTTTWRVSLLDAALHNFELHETLPYAYLSGSGYISRPGMPVGISSSSITSPSTCPSRRSRPCAEH